ncbi:glycoside hydrolase family 43 protein [Micromonospora sp. PPF5-17]|uniref:Glycoside hydrolase family 43 protein n=2 Tax=Micromonosporaceae TaxID=28056 RepID=A0ABX9WED8_9ACTN|nr:glycoside hydrolase family 43 protein [Micromonospora solifontis]NES58676.1 glycoside hydrolase family 43 protein [Micromonospora sp. PPF5-6]RNL96371.1 glycoside hydrolase family 43 protein [Micromonospora solifontis]
MARPRAATAGASGWTDGTFANPVIAGMHPDPSVCRVGDDYYLACSSFEYFPGVPLFHSRDLVHWAQIGNVLDRPGQLDLPPTTPPSAGVYAPTLRHHDGRFWLIVTNVADGGGTFICTATDPAGAWSDPVRVPGIVGIDPDLAWDDEGNCWCTYAGIEQVRIDPRTGETIGRPHRLWSGAPGAQAPEAPHLYRVGDHWYLLIAEGGTERGHAVSIARATAPDGPYEPCPANPVLTHRGTNRPIQNTGHADLVEAADGSWWMVLLGVRPGGGTPGWHVLGRETFLAPVTWTDGWPVVGAVTPAMTAPSWPAHPLPAPPVRDDFDADRLGPRWLSVRSRPADSWSLTERPGWLTLRARGASLDAPDVTFVGRRQQHLSCRVRARVDPAGGRGGLAVRLDERHHYDIEAGDGAVRVDARLGSVLSTLAVRPVPAGPVSLLIEVLGPSPGDWYAGKEPDLLRFGVEQADGTVTVLAELDGRYLSTEVAGGFTGRVIGMYAATGTVHFDWLDYEPRNPGTGSGGDTVLAP